MAEGIASWGDYYMSRTAALSRRHRELVIDRVTARCGADYEWGVHIAHLADRVGLTGPQIRSLAVGDPDDTCWDAPEDRAILRAVDELHRTHDLLDHTWAALVDAAGEEGAVEVVLLTGWYAAISSLVRTLRLPMEPATREIRATVEP